MKQGAPHPNYKKGRSSCLKSWEAKEWAGEGLFDDEAICADLGEVRASGSPGVMGHGVGGS